MNGFQCSVESSSIIYETKVLGSCRTSPETKIASLPTHQPVPPEPQGSGTSRPNSGNISSSSTSTRATPLQLLSRSHAPYFQDDVLCIWKPDIQYVFPYLKSGCLRNWEARAEATSWRELVCAWSSSWMNRGMNK